MNTATQTDLSYDLVLKAVQEAAHPLRARPTTTIPFWS